MRREGERYSLVGAACVGKTTTWEALRIRHTNPSKVLFVHEAGTAYFTEHPEALSDVFSFQTQSLLQELSFQSAQVARAVNTCGKLIADRGLLDSPMHLRVIGDTNGADALLDRVLLLLPSYTYLHFRTEGVPYLGNEVRTEDDAFRLEVDRAYASFFAEHQGLRSFAITGTPEQRLHQAEEIIFQYSP